MSRIQTQDASLNSDFDIQIDSEGDILTEDFFDTSLKMSIYCEQRALESEMPASHLRRGWIGNLAEPDFEIGSKLWLLYQAKKTAETANGVKTAIENCLKWLVADQYAVGYTVKTIITDASVSALVEIERSSSKVEKRLFELWNNTGQ